MDNNDEREVVDLEVNMVLDDGSKVGVQLDGCIVERIIQEEIWAQTDWPKGEPSLTDLVRLLNDPKLIDLMRSLAAALDAAAIGFGGALDALREDN